MALPLSDTNSSCPLCWNFTVWISQSSLLPWAIPAFLLASQHLAADAMETAHPGIPLHCCSSASLCYSSTCINHCYGSCLSHFHADCYGSADLSSAEEAAQVTLPFKTCELKIWVNASTLVWQRLSIPWQWQSHYCHSSAAQREWDLGECC